MKIDRSKWEDEDWDMEDDLPGRRLTHKDKIVKDEKKASIQKKRKEKMRMRAEEERYMAREMDLDAQYEDIDK